MIALEPGCFGKLPIHADFIRFNAGPDIGAFDGFLQRGILTARQALGDGWRAAYDAAAPRAFVRHLPEQRRFLCGVMVSSQGKAGRDFPFLVCCTLGDAALRRRPALLPLLCAPFFAGARELVTRDWTGADVGAVRQAVAGLAAALDPKAAARRLDALLADTSFDGLVAAALGAADERRELLLLNATSLLGPRSRPRFALVLPRVPDADAAALWLETATVLRGGPERFPHLVSWDLGDEAGLRCVLVEPAGEHYAPLFLPAAPSDACELYREGLDSESLLAKASARFGAVVADPRLTIGKLLSLLG